jgi:hypothetical protein
MQRVKIQVFFLALITCTIFSSTAYAQVYGCKDPAASNYNPNATVNDGSCVYDATNYTPPIKVDTMHATLAETSGLQFAGNHLWSFNDGGGANAIYRIDTLTKTIFQTVNIDGATNVDWEDIAFDGSYFYIGDFGNNANGARTNLKIYKFPISVIPDYPTNPVVNISAANVEVINFTYADQPQPPVPAASNATKFDCEAMIVDAGKIHLFSKNWVDLNTTHYVIDGTAAGTYVANPLETLATGYLVTAADKAVGQEVVALLGYQNSGFANHFMHFLSDYSGGSYFNGNKRKINLPNAFTMGQAEGLTFKDGTYGYISNEYFSPVAVPQRLRSFNSSSFVSPTVLASDLNDFAVTNIRGTHKINWQFNSPVKNLQVQHSADGINYTSIKYLANSFKDEMNYLPAVKNNYYRLAWQHASGGYEFSNVISMINKITDEPANFILTPNGELSFSINSRLATRLAFNISSVDGKMLMKIPAKTYNVGINKIQLNKSNLPATVLITAYNEQVKTSKLLWVGY